MSGTGDDVAVQERRSGSRLLAVFAFVAATVVALAMALAWLWSQSPWRGLESDKRYAIVLTNGQIFFARPAVSLFAPGALRLSVVFYVLTQVSPVSRASTNVLVKRGNEWHGPSGMHVNVEHILLVEPVGEGSKVDELIRQLKAQPPAQN